MGGIGCAKQVRGATGNSNELGNTVKGNKPSIGG